MSSMRKVFVALLMVMVASGAAFATNVTFQVNMSFQETLGNLNTDDGDVVVVRGTFTTWGDGTPIALTEGEEGVWSGTGDIEEGEQEYKFVIEHTDDTSMWEELPEGGNRPLTVGTDPISLDLVWFADQEPVETANVEIYFSVDMSVQILTGNFDADVDVIGVTGNQTVLTNWGGGYPLVRETGSDIYGAWVQIPNVVLANPITYKFRISPNGITQEGVGWEASSDRTITVTGTEEDSDENGFGEIIPDVPFFSNIDASGILTDPVEATFIVNTRPAYYKIDDPDSTLYDVQDFTEITTIESFQINGLNNTWIDWNSEFPAELFMNDDGTDGDETANDTIWTLQYTFTAGSPKEQTYKGGINQLDAEAEYEADHHSTLSEDNTPVGFYWVWGAQGHLFDAYLDLVSVEPQDSDAMPGRFELEQNYPNPFNPTTTVGFSLPAAGEYILTVFNVNGQIVSLEKLGNLAAGRYTATIDGSKLASGTYVYSLQGNGYIATRKMTLLK